MFEVRRCLARFDELILQGARPFENIFDEIGGHSHRITESPRQVEDETVGGLRCRREGVFGALALLLGNLPLFIGKTLLLNRDAPLPKGERREGQGDQKSGGKAAREDVASPRGSASALG